MNAEKIVVFHEKWDRKCAVFEKCLSKVFVRFVSHDLNLVMGNREICFGFGRIPI